MRKVYTALRFFGLLLLLTGTFPAWTQSIQVTPLAGLSGPVSAATGQKPQSKLWKHDGKWFSVLAIGGNTRLYRLDGTTWTELSVLINGNRFADCKAVGDLVHILLYEGAGTTSLVSLQYDSQSGSYAPWSSRPAAVAIPLDAGVETATIDIDENGRMFLASEGTSTVQVRWSDAPYSTWNGPVTLASNLDSDDITAIIAMPGKIGVLWSNQTAAVRRFGFRTLPTGADPAELSNWTPDEVPASQSAESASSPMADDHLNMKVAGDGTLYCAVKTSYDNSAYPVIALLVRRPDGSWDDLYAVTNSTGATRPIVVLSEEQNRILVAYTVSESGGNIVFKASPADVISFGSQTTIITGSYNNATSSKGVFSDEVVILAASSSQVGGALIQFADTPPPPEGDLVGYWDMEEESGSTLVDKSAFENNGTLSGNATRGAGPVGQGLVLDGDNDYVTIPHSNSLMPQEAITLAAWIRPQKQGTQRIIHKVASSTGYELFLANSTTENFSVRFNNSASLRVNSVSSYLDFLNTWVHVAATYDRTSIKLYINGQLETTLPATAAIAANTATVGIGATAAGADDFQGGIDEVRIYNMALTANQIAALMSTPPPAEAALVGHWEMNEGGGTLLNDATAYQNHATTVNNPAFEPGISGMALSLNGSQHAVVADHASLDVTAYITLAAWIKPSVQGTQYIIKKGKIGLTDGYELALSNAGHPFFRLNQASHANTYRVDAAATYPSDGQTWMHVVATYDGSYLRIYVDGVLDGENHVGPLNIATNDLPLVIGGEHDENGRFTGAIDDARVYSGVLSDADIATLAIIPPPVGEESGGPGLGLYFDGQGKVEVPDHSSLDISQQITLEAWVMPEATTTQRLILKGTQGDTNGFELSLSAQDANANQKFFMRFNQPAGGDTYRINSTSIYQPGVWTHVAGTYDGTTMRLYVNGVLEAEKAAAVTIETNNLPLTFGAQSQGSQYRFTGAMDEIRIWNIARTAEEIRSAMSRPLSGNEPGLVGYWKLDEMEGYLILDKGPNRLYGVISGLNPSTARDWSGARMGDESVSDFDPAGGFTAELAHPDGDFITVTASSGDNNGLLVYRADHHPLREGATLVNDFLPFSERYWGVQLVGTNAPTYTLVYHFEGHPDIGNKNNLRLVKRAGLSDDAWVDAGAVLDANANTLTITGATGTEYAMVYLDAALPVAMTELRAAAVTQGVLLRWETLSESRNAGFEVQHSPDGIAFTTLAFVPTSAEQGNSQTLLAYSYLDQSASSGSHYYRLRQIDQDGKQTIGKIVQLQLQIPVFRVERAYPNPLPASGRVQLDLSAENQTELMITLTDPIGRIYAQRKQLIAKGRSTLSIPVDGISKGLYLLRIAAKNGEVRQTLPLIRN